MSEDLGTQIPPLEPPQKKNNTLIIVIVVLIVLCCCCAVGSYVTYQYLGDMILEWLRNQGYTLLQTVAVV